MDEEAPRRGSVLLRGDRIEYVGPTASLPSAPNAHVVDGSGRFLIPGLIDMHTHVSKTRGRLCRCWFRRGSRPSAISAGITRNCSPGAARSKRAHGSVRGC
jgi:dihydroorotase-like cyclic amidohydrolase